MFYSLSDLDHSNCVTEQDKVYSGNDVNDGTTNIQPDVDSCRSSCHAIYAPYFSYHPMTNQRCWCKSTDAGRTTYAGAVAGGTACAGKKNFYSKCNLIKCRILAYRPRCNLKPSTYVTSLLVMPLYAFQINPVKMTVKM